VYNLRMNKLLVVFALVITSCLSQAVESVWTKASLISGVPEKKIYAIALQESKLLYPDQKMRPWPWTVNSRHGSMRFKSKAEAYKAIQALVDEGETNIDLGLMQVNYGFHKKLIGNSDVLDPSVNILLAAEILRKNMVEAKGDVRKAVAFYHSRNPERATNYDSKIRENELLVSRAFP
jgi:Transglycosylase SLT domain